MSKANSFEMVDCPVAELDGIALDYAVALVEGGHSLKNDGITWWVTMEGLSRVLSQGWGSIGYQPSKEWAQGGPIIEREGINVYQMQDGTWQANLDYGVTDEAICHGPTPLVAAVRCYVASKLGNSIKVPKGLIEG